MICALPIKEIRAAKCAAVEVKDGRGIGRAEADVVGGDCGRSSTDGERGCGGGVAIPAAADVETG